MKPRTSILALKPFLLSSLVLLLLGPSLGSAAFWRYLGTRGDEAFFVDEDSISRQEDDEVAFWTKTVWRGKKLDDQKMQVASLLGKKHNVSRPPAAEVARQINLIRDLDHRATKWRWNSRLNVLRSEQWAYVSKSGEAIIVSDYPGEFFSIPKGSLFEATVEDVKAAKEDEGKKRARHPWISEHTAGREVGRVGASMQLAIHAPTVKITPNEVSRLAKGGLR